MASEKRWRDVSTLGYLAGFCGVFLVMVTYIADSAAPQGSLIFNLQTVGWVLLLAGFTLAVVAGIMLGNMWPYGPIK